MTRGTVFGGAALAGLLAAAPLACRRSGEGDPAPAPSASEAPADVSRRAAVLRTLLVAEYARSSAALPDDALSDHDVVVRRAAARALSRIADAHAVELLGKSLSDEDDEVIAWSAYGLGGVCPVGDTRTVRALVTRALSLDLSKDAEPSRKLSAPSPRDAIFDALARCGSAPAEQTLRAWLGGPPAARSSAALALGRLAARRRRLDDASVVALLDAAGSAPPVHGALFAFAELDAVSEVSAKRLVKVAAHAVETGGPERAFAIAAMVAAGAVGADALLQPLTDDQVPRAERSLAAATLGRIGKAGKRVLETALAALVPAAAPLDRALLERRFAPLSAVLTALEPPVESSSAVLARLAEVPVPDGGEPFLVHRLVALRCGAAAVLSGTASQSARLVRCDPDPHGRQGALAAIRVLDRDQLAGPRRKVWAEYARSVVPGARRAALSLLPRHPEAAPAIDELVQALGAREPGVVAQAARVLADAPVFAAAHAASAAAATKDRGPEASPAIVEALTRAMDAERPGDQIEARVALAGAAASVGALSLKPRLEKYCVSDNVTLRQAAQAALRSVGATDVRCDGPKERPVSEPSSARGPVTLTFVTEGGRCGMTLDPLLSPFAVDRVVELAQKGFYDGLAILRVSPGYVVQLGDSTGDGSGGSGRPPLPSEGAPVEPFALSVGLALGGKDTGSSQIFVALAEEPQLFGDYPLLGWADPEWGNVAEGDKILRVEIHE